MAVSLSVPETKAHSTKITSDPNTWYHVPEMSLFLLKGKEKTSINLFIPAFFLVLFSLGNLQLSHKAKFNEGVIYSGTYRTRHFKFCCYNVTPTFNTLAHLKVWRVVTSLSVPQSCWWKRRRNHFSSWGCFAQRNICPGEAGSITNQNKNEQEHHLLNLVPESALGKIVPGTSRHLGCRDQRQMDLVVAVFSLPPWETPSKGLAE